MGEIRAQRLDLAARAKFADDGERIFETRHEIDPIPERDEAASKSAEALTNASLGGFVEVA